MNRATKTIQLSDYDVDIKDSLTWGENEEIDASVIEGASSVDVSGLKDFDMGKAMRNRKYKVIEIAIVSIKDKKGKEVKYSREWLNNLSIEEGDKVYQACEELTKKK